jgi:hypothetical protein
MKNDRFLSPLKSPETFAVNLFRLVPNFTAVPLKGLSPLRNRILLPPAVQPVSFSSAMVHKLYIFFFKVEMPVKEVAGSEATAPAHPENHPFLKTQFRRSISGNSGEEVFHDPGHHLFICGDDLASRHAFRRNRGVSLSWRGGSVSW